MLLFFIVRASSFVKHEVSVVKRCSWYVFNISVFYFWG